MPLAMSAPEPPPADETPAGGAPSGAPSSPASVPVPAAQSLAVLPPLGAMAALTSFGELLLRRGALRTLDVSYDTLLTLGRVGDFLVNLAAISGLIALGGVVRDFVVTPAHLRVWQRLTLAAMSGLMMPVILVALVIPATGAFRYVGPLGVAFGVLLAFQMTTMGIRLFGATYARTSAVLAMTAVLSGIFSLLRVTLIELGSPIPALSAGANGMIMFGEVCFFGVPLLLGLALAKRVEPGRVALRFAGAALVFGLSAGLLGWGAFTYRTTFETIVVGALDTTLFADAPEVYALLLPMCVGAMTLGLLHPRTAARQLGFAMMLWISAGFTPRTPSRVLMMVLAAALLARGTAGMGRSADSRARRV